MQTAFAICKRNFESQFGILTNCNKKNPEPQLLLLTTHTRILTTNKLIRASTILSIPIYATTQNRARLGPIVREIQIPHAMEHVDKTAFSMWIPQISRHFSTGEVYDVAIVGIETQICVTQTALDLLADGHNVYIIADGVSSTNSQEIAIALRRLRDAGAVVTTSESWLYMCMGDAAVHG